MQSDNNSKRCYNCVNCIAKLPLKDGIILYELGKVTCRKHMWSFDLKFVTGGTPTFTGYGLGEGIRENTKASKMAEKCQYYEE